MSPHVSRENFTCEYNLTILKTEKYIGFADSTDWDLPYNTICFFMQIK